MSVLRFDPFRGFDRLVAEHVAGLRGAPRSVEGCLPVRISSSSISICPESIPTRSNCVEQNMLTIKAERRFEPGEGDELVITVRPQGTSHAPAPARREPRYRPPRSRLRPGRAHAEAAKPRRVETTQSASGQRSIVEGQATHKS